MKTFLNYNIFLNYRVLLFLLHFFTLTTYGQNIINDSITRYKITNNHPSVEQNKPFTQTIYYNTNQQEFSTTVESVICKTKVCKIVPVNITWTEIGFFKNISLFNNDYLEKDEGKPFTDEDYLKLDDILNNPKSKLRGVDIGDIKDYNPDDVDAITGATIVIEEDQIVKGAAWTCYTLWHYVYSKASKNIRRLFSKNFTTTDYIKHLNNSNSDHKIFALEQLTKNSIYLPELNHTLIQQANTGDIQITKAINTYLETIPQEKSTIYFSLIDEILKIDEHKKRIIFLNNLKHNHFNLPSNFDEQLINITANKIDYQQLSLIFDIIDEKKINSPKLNQNLVQLLKHDSFIIARSVYWHLKNKTISKEILKKLKKFKSKNKKRL